MDVAFVLPNIPRNPGGGAKMVFQYADYLAIKGNVVTIYYMTDRFLKGRLPDAVRKRIGHIYSRHCPDWYELNKNIIRKAAFDKSDIKDHHDVIIATAVMTAVFVNSLLCHAVKYYFIQGFETFYTNEEEVFQSYRLQLRKIVISKWLKEIVHSQTGEIPVYIPNGIDLSVFKPTVPIEQREKHSLAFHYRNAVLKGCEYAVKTIDYLRDKYPDLEVYVIGNVDCPESLKGKCRYYKNITEKEVADINNRIRVFMSTSIEEGFGLPGLEAMACGCALVTTDYAGAREYAINEHNALISPVRDYMKMAENVIRLFEEEMLLYSISYEAVQSAKRFSLSNSREDFMKELCCSNCIHLN